MKNIPYNHSNRRKFRIRKASGEIEPFSKKKLCQSLEHSGLPKVKCKIIADDIAGKVGEGSPTYEIYEKTLSALKGTSPLASIHYSLKKSLFDLGPEGHHFETYTARYFEEIGHQTETCRVLEGKYVKHEVDVIATLKGKRYFSECKFHNHSGVKNDIKIALYVKARWDDLRDGPEGKNLHGFYVISNTKFSIDAITYAKGTGLKLLGVNCPAQHSFLDEIKKLKLYPVTSLTQINKNIKNQLLARNILLAKDLIDEKSFLIKLGLSAGQMEKVFQEIHFLQRDKR